MAGILDIDKKWDAALPWSFSIDNRYRYYLVKADDFCGDEIRKKSGGLPVGAAKIMWINGCFVDTYKKVSKFLNLQAYVSGRLCNLKFDKSIIRIRFWTPWIYRIVAKVVTRSNNDFSKKYWF